MIEFELGMGRRHGFNLSSGKLSSELSLIPTNQFISTWNTEQTSAGSSNSVQIKLPLVSTGTYNFTVDWGDGNTDTITTWNQAEVTHTYSSAGNYTLTITGQIEGWSFGNSGDRLKILNVTRWGPFTLIGTGGFYGCTNLQSDAADSPNVRSDVTNLSNTFRTCTLFNGVVNGMQMENITTIDRMFQSCSLFDQDLSGWQVDSLVNLNVAFWGSSNFTGKGLEQWNPSTVTNLFQSFYNTSFNADISGWSIGTGLNLDYTFGNTNFNHDISGWDPAPISMQNTFRFTPFDQDISGWDVTGLAAADNCFLGGSLSTTNYDLLLVGWEAQATLNSVTFHAGSAKYSAGAPATARAALIADHSWTITDGGPA